MHKMLTPLTLGVVLCAGYSLNWLKDDQPRKAVHAHSTRELGATEAALRHKHGQPSHWRAMFLHQQ